MDSNLTNMLSNKIQYIGCDDATLDLFESQYSLPNSMCYNSYLLLGERVVVMDSVILSRPSSPSVAPGKRTISRTWRSW
ncbi:MAG: hypothetical protein II248_06675 [Paludibacteraceae bacterium]|nr:hypothetical protein [Paludibacteraceae bacterium]MBQ2291819.1 hypothetical protein [Paludibacteraceae bacterium]